MSLTNVNFHTHNAPTDMPVVALVSRLTGELVSVIVVGEDAHYYAGHPTSPLMSEFRWFPKEEWTLADGAS